MANAPLCVLDRNSARAQTLFLCLQYETEACGRDSALGPGPACSSALCLDEGHVWGQNQMYTCPPQKMN